MAGGNIIDQVAVLHVGFSDGEIHIAEKDFVLGTDDRAVISFLDIEPPEHLNMQCLVFTNHEETHLKPCIKYPPKLKNTSLRSFGELWT
jgi:hypothetical protein